MNDLQLDGATVLLGDCIARMKELPAGSAQMSVTSPPYYGLRDYGHDGQIGLEETPEAYIAKMVEVFREVRRVLADDGTLWLNIGDSYASAWACSRRNQVGNGSLANGKREHRPNRLTGDLKEKDLIGIPWMLAFALRADGSVSPAGDHLAQVQPGTGGSRGARPLYQGARARVPAHEAIPIPHRYGHHT